MNALYEESPYYWSPLGIPHTEGWWSWSEVIGILQKYEDTGMIQPQLPRSIQRRGSVFGLAIGLAVRQAALTAITS